MPSTRLALDEEYRDICQRIRASPYRYTLDVDIHLATRPSDLQQALLTYMPTVVHFSGHGEGSDGLVFHGDAIGEEKLVSGTALENLFAILPDNLRVVILNACHSKFQAEAIVRHVDFVIGMNASIKDEAARLFSSSFYLGLGYGRSIETAFHLGLNALRLEGLKDEQVPVLLVRQGAKSWDSLLGQGGF